MIHTVTARETKDIKINAFTNYPEAPIHVAEFVLGLSIKDKSS